MKKEVFFAVLLGLSLGLIVTYGVYRANQANTQDQVDTLLQESAAETIDPTANGISSLVIDAPENESIVDEAKQTIAGTTLANAFVVIYVNETPYMTTADQTGAFSISADLSLGSNVIGVHSLSEDGNEAIAEIVVSYTTQPLIPQPSASESAETTEGT